MTFAQEINTLAGNYNSGSSGLPIAVFGKNDRGLPSGTVQNPFSNSPAYSNTPPSPYRN